MESPLAYVQRPFAERTRSPAWWAYVALRVGRMPLAFALVLAPAVLLVLAVALAPPAFGEAVTDPDNVSEVFARFVSGVVTAATIAVAVASLALSRELKGIKEQDERHQADMQYRHRVGRRAGAEGAPLPVGAFLALALDNVRASAERARAEATPDDLAATYHGARLDDFLDALATRAEDVARRLDARRAEPHRMFDAALDFETEMTSHLAHGFERSPDLSPQAREAVEGLSACLRDFVVGVHYAKTLDIQWGLGRMAIFIALSALPAILAAVVTALSYGEGARDLLGVTGAAALVAGALALSLLPVGGFVSYILRFLTVNEHTLPTEGFVLGPEAWDVAREEDAFPRRRGAPGGP